MSSDGNVNEDWSSSVRWLVLQIFVPILGNDPDATSQVRRFGGGLAALDGCMTFTLPALYQFVCRARGIPAANDDFSGFRRALYGFGVNSILREKGGLVVVVGNEDDSPTTRIYRLERSPSS